MTRKILVVEDDPILRVALQKRLAACRDSFAVATAADGFEAIKKLGEYPFSLLVTNLSLSRMDGKNFIAHVRAEHPDLPIIVVAATQPAAAEEKIRVGGVLAYLAKPLRADELIAHIMNSLRREADGGIMYDVSPTVFLQLMEMEAKTCTIRIFDKASARGGIVHFIDGRLVDARVGERRGIDAACEIFTWEMVTLYIHNGCSPRKDTVNSELQPIIMKAAGMRDEAVDPAPGGRDDEEEDPVITQVRAILLKAGGADCLAGFAFDGRLDRAAGHLQLIGGAAGFGAFRAGLVSGGKHDRLFLSSGPAMTFTVKAASVQPPVLERIRAAVSSLQDGRRESSP